MSRKSHESEAERLVARVLEEREKQAKLASGSAFLNEFRKRRSKGEMDGYAALEARWLVEYESGVTPAEFLDAYEGKPENPLPPPGELGRTLQAKLSEFARGGPISAEAQLAWRIAVRYSVGQFDPLNPPSRMVARWRLAVEAGVATEEFVKEELLGPGTDR